jgi:hypothetical protein
MSDDQDQEFEDLNPQTPQGTPVPGEPEGNVPLEDVQASLDEVMDSLDQELPQPNLESDHLEQPAAEDNFEFVSLPIEVDDGGEDVYAEDPFVPPTEEVQDVAQRDQNLASELESLEASSPAQAEAVQPAQPQGARGFNFPGLPQTAGGQGAETLADDGFFTQKMEQEGAGRDAQSDMFRAETRHHGLMNEAMIEYARHLDLLSDRYERDRL